MKYKRKQRSTTETSIKFCVRSIYKSIRYRKIIPKRQRIDVLRKFYTYPNNFTISKLTFDFRGDLEHGNLDKIKSMLLYNPKTEGFYDVSFFRGCAF